MHNVHAEIAGPRDTHQRIHVGAVHVKQRAFFMQDVRDALDVFFENPERVGVRDHEGGDILIHNALEQRKIHHSAVVRVNILDSVTGGGSGGGVGSMGGIGNQDLLARVAAL